MANGVRRKSNVFGHLRYFLKKWRLPVASIILISGCITAIVFIVPMVNSVDIKDNYTKAISAKLKEVLHAEYNVINKNEEENKVEYLFKKNGSTTSYQTASYTNEYTKFKIVNQTDNAPVYVRVAISTTADITSIDITTGNTTSSINTKIPSEDKLKVGIKDVVFKIIMKNKSSTDKEKLQNVATVFTFEGAQEKFTTEEEALEALWDSSPEIFKWIVVGSNDTSGTTKQEAIASWITREKGKQTKKIGPAGLPKGTKASTMGPPTTSSSFEYFVYDDKIYTTEQELIDSITSLSTSKTLKKISLRVHGKVEYKNKAEMKNANLIKTETFVIKS